jgi:hypothetical protein
VANAGGPGGGHSSPEVRTIGRICPQQGCSGLGLKPGGVGSQAPGSDTGMYVQLLYIEYPSVAAHSRIAAATAWPCATERSYTGPGTTACCWDARLCSRVLIACREACEIVG